MISLLLLFSPFDILRCLLSLDARRFTRMLLLMPLSPLLSATPYAADVISPADAYATAHTALRYAYAAV